MISVKVDRPNQVLYFSSLSALGRWGTSKPDLKCRPSRQVFRFCFLVLSVVSSLLSKYTWNLEFKTQLICSFVHCSQSCKNPKTFQEKLAIACTACLIQPKMINLKNKLSVCHCQHLSVNPAVFSKMETKFNQIGKLAIQLHPSSPLPAGPLS